MEGPYHSPVIFELEHGLGWGGTRVADYPSCQNRLLVTRGPAQPWTWFRWRFLILKRQNPITWELPQTLDSGFKFLIERAMAVFQSWKISLVARLAAVPHVFSFPWSYNLIHFPFFITNIFGHISILWCSKQNTETKNAFVLYIKLFVSRSCCK